MEVVFSFFLIGFHWGSVGKVEGALRSPSRRLYPPGWNPLRGGTEPEALGWRQEGEDRRSNDKQFTIDDGRGIEKDRGWREEGGRKQ